MANLGKDIGFLGAPNMLLSIPRKNLLWLNSCLVGTRKPLHLALSECAHKPLPWERVSCLVCYYFYAPASFLWSKIRLSSKKSGLAIRDLDFWVLSLGRSQGGNHWFLGWFSRVLCAALTLPHRLIKQTPSPQGAQTEDIANTEGKHKQEVIILPNSHNYSDKKSYSKGMLPRLLVLQLKPASPIRYLSFNFQKRGGKPSMNPSLKKQTNVIKRDTWVSICAPKMYIHTQQREQWNKLQP